MDAVRDFEFCTNILQPMLLVFLGFLCLCRTSQLYGLLETIVGHEWDKLFELWTELRRAILFFFPPLNPGLYQRNYAKDLGMCQRHHSKVLALDCAFSSKVLKKNANNFSEHSSSAEF